MRLKIKRIVASIVFIAILSTLIMNVGYAMRVPTTKSEQDTQIFIKGFYSEPDDSLSVVLMGSSALYRYYVAPLAWEKFGFTSYSYASTCQSNDVTEYLMEDIQRSQTPDLYVVEVRQLVRGETFEHFGKDELPKDREDAYDSFLTNSMEYSLARFGAVNELFDTDVLSYQIDVIRNHVLWKGALELDNTALSTDYSKEFPYKSGRTVAIQRPFKCNDLKDYKESIKLTDDAYRQMDEVFEYIKENDLNVLFVSTPYVETEQTMSIENAVEDYMKKNGMNYLNCNKYYDEMGIDFEKDFYNAKHVNVIGASKVTEFLGKYITENFEINKDYSEAVKKSWDKGYELWDAKRQQQLEKIAQNAK